MENIFCIIFDLCSARVKLINTPSNGNGNETLTMIVLGTRCKLSEMTDRFVPTKKKKAAAANCNPMKCSELPTPQLDSTRLTASSAEFLLDCFAQKVFKYVGPPKKNYNKLATLPTSSITSHSRTRTALCAFVCEI